MSEANLLWPHLRSGAFKQPRLATDRLNIHDHVSQRVVAGDSSL